MHKPNILYIQDQLLSISYGISAYEKIDSSLVYSVATMYLLGKLRVVQKEFL
jgi:hypothetical protein